jgi:hypothetical protein
MEQTDSGTPERDGADGLPPSPDMVANRADGRPPEERSSEDPEAQARAILEESEERIEDGARESTQGA